jgi:uncharacterized protein YutE (UPF0331/DUF86 family)
VVELDRERVLIKIDQLDGYLRELSTIAPRTRAEYTGTEKKRACERLLQLSVEVVIDVCAILVAGLRLGLPAEEDDLIRRLAESGVLSSELADTVREMRAFRNVLVHEYARIDDELVFEAISRRDVDFVSFRQEVLDFLQAQPR